MTLDNNPWAWNRIANVIFLEAPCGVGFSYSNTPSDYITDDTKTAKDNHIFVQKFLKTFPQYAKNEFWISGERYLE